MLILAVALAGLTAWLGQQLVNGQLAQQRQRTLALAVAGAAAAVLFGIAIAKAPIVGKAVDHGTAKVADVAGVAYHPADALATPGACPAPTRPAITGSAR